MNAKMSWKQVSPFHVTWQLISPLISHNTIYAKNTNKNCYFLKENCIGTQDFNFQVCDIFFQRKLEGQGFFWWSISSVSQGFLKESVLMKEVPHLAGLVALRS